MKVVLVGANGQLGQCLQDVFPVEWIIYAFSSKNLDVTNIASIQKVVDISPDVIINASAYTKVDLAETEVEQANLVNAVGVYHLAKAAQKCNARLIHISTDYVFDGTKNQPYTEEDVTCPLNVYGQSKLAGENLALSTCVDTLILRTSWVFSEYGNNFLKTMLRIGKENSELRIVGDQIGTPTYAVDIAFAIVALIEKHRTVRGILNIAGKDICSWAEFAQNIFKIANQLDNAYKIPHVTAITSAEYKVVAKRPMYSVLNTQAACSFDIEVGALIYNVRMVLTKLLEQKI